MRTPGTPAELERRRLLALRRIRAGHAVEEVADILGVTPRSVRRWVAAHAATGASGLRAQTATGRPPKLDHTQEKIVRRWLSGSPSDHGFPTELWTAKRLAAVIRQTWQVSFNPRYLCDWLGQRGYTPQKPLRVPQERDDRAIRNWCRHDWPRIQKKSAGTVPTSSSSTRAGC